MKNLPKVISEQKIRDLFSQKGTLTDVQLKHKDGKFRQFGFIGYENEDSAREAVNHFNNTFIGTSKIRVEVCAVLGDESKPKSWSKYAKDSEVHKKNEKKEKSVDVAVKRAVKEDKKSKKIGKIESIIGEHKDDPLFQEFMHSHAKDKLAWQNDVGIGKEEEEAEDFEGEECNEKLANREISDKAYMMNLMGESDSKEKLEKKMSKISEADLAKLYTIKIRNIPKKIKREELIKFFRPSKAHSVRIPRTGAFAYVGFKLERDMLRALTKDKSFLKGKQVSVVDFTEKNFSSVSNAKPGQRENPRLQEQQDLLKQEEAICDSGKLFFRNLAYTVTEDDVQKLFEKHGTVVEVNVPIDSVTRKIKVRKNTSSLQKKRNFS